MGERHPHSTNLRLEIPLLDAVELLDWLRRCRRLDNAPTDSVDRLIDEIDITLYAGRSMHSATSAGVEPCGAWPKLGGCTLESGHNIGRADVPENHQFVDNAGYPRENAD